MDRDWLGLAISLVTPSVSVCGFCFFTQSPSWRASVWVLPSRAIPACWVEKRCPCCPQGASSLALPIVGTQEASSVVTQGSCSISVEQGGGMREELLGGLATLP